MSAMHAIPLLALLALPACGAGDFSRPGTWQATGVNDRNLQAVPAHAARGVSAPDERGQAGTAPVGRLLRNTRPALPARGGALAGESSPPSPAPAPTPGGTDGR
jgi:hypothetical protein